MTAPGWWLMQASTPLKRPWRVIQTLPTRVSSAGHPYILIVPLTLPLLHRGLHCDRRREGGRAVHVVTAAVAWRTLLDRLLVGDGLLAEPREGVELTHEPDGRASLAVAPRRHEGGGHIRHAPLDLEALLLDPVGEELARLRLLQADLGVLPRRVADPYDLLLVLVHPVERCLLRQINREYLARLGYKTSASLQDEKRYRVTAYLGPNACNHVPECAFRLYIQP